jgi:BirA family biotin operon repressor/biotin-[acetyl-CoA-carboxylase] ligase
MATELGVSRVAVWKGIQSLNATGYRITATDRGYVLEQAPVDGLFPWEFGSDEKRFRYWATTDSTMNRAREAALSGAAAGTVFMADAQSAGRGTGSKNWVSVPGGLFFTVVTRPVLETAFYHRSTLAASLAITRAIQRLSGLEAFPLWPNDIMVRPVGESGSCGKVGGILGEMLATGNAVSFMNLGVGINTGRKPDLETAAAVTAPRKDLLGEFLAEFARINVAEEALISAWNAACPACGKPVSFRSGANGTTEEGIFRGTDRAGWAIIENETEKRHFPPGSVILLEKGNNA